MAFAARRSAADPTEIDLPRRADDVAWRAASELLTAFNRRYDRLKDERLRLVLEHALAGRPSGAKASTADDALRQRLSQLQKLPPINDAMPPPSEEGTPANATIARGLEVLAGRMPAVPASHSERVAEIDRQMQILRDAICEQTQIVADADDSFNHHASAMIVDAWDAHVLAVFRAEQALSVAAQQFRRFRARMVESGIRGYSTLLRCPELRAAIMVGDEGTWGSEIATARRQLESWGML